MPVSDGASNRAATPISSRPIYGRFGIDVQTESKSPQKKAAGCKIGHSNSPVIHRGHNFASIPIHDPNARVILTKLEVAQADDVCEREAEHVSEKVAGSPAASLLSLSAYYPRDARREDLAKQSSRLRITRFDEGASAQSTAPEIVDQVLRSSGQPLDRATRAFMEPRFNYDFGKVRVHTDARAAESARSMKSMAYTVGHDVVFATGRFSPETAAGRRLLAHELTHVLQQSPPLGVPSSKALGSNFAEPANAVSRQQGPRNATPRFVQRFGEVGMAMGMDAAARAKAKKLYAKFADSLSFEGLPVKFLTDVGKVVAVLHDTKNAYAPGNDEMHLKRETIEGALSPITDSSTVQSIYHESTHAYLTEHRHQDPVRKFYEEGTKYYEGAPTVRNGTTSDPEEVFQESAAAYVGSRAGAWMLAYRSVLFWVQHGNRPFNLDDIAGTYNKTMAQRVFGYSTEGGFFSKKQVSTKRPIAEDARAFLDHELLEGKIPDSFDQVVAFKRLVANASLVRSTLRSWPAQAGQTPPA
jgi:hypothetical protein